MIHFKYSHRFATSPHGREKMGNGNHYEILPCHLVRRLQSKRQIIASVGEDVGN